MEYRQAIAATLDKCGGELDLVCIQTVTDEGASGVLVWFRPTPTGPEYVVHDWIWWHQRDPFVAFERGDYFRGDDAFKRSTKTYRSRGGR